jgi:ferric-dicitrate binding protein FerR (iron transport regulator)
MNDLTELMGDIFRRRAERSERRRRRLDAAGEALVGAGIVVCAVLGWWVVTMELLGLLCGKGGGG